MWYVAPTKKLFLRGLPIDGTLYARYGEEEPMWYVVGWGLINGEPTKKLFLRGLPVVTESGMAFSARPVMDVRKLGQDGAWTPENDVYSAVIDLMIAITGRDFVIGEKKDG